MPHAPDAWPYDLRLKQLAGARALVVASSGGHISEAVRLADRLELAADSHFVTFDTPQTRSLLAGRSSSFVPYVRPRDPFFTAIVSRRLARLDFTGYDFVVSTGSAVAISAWHAARKHRRPLIYIESLARTHGPSMSGRILGHLPGVETFTQHRHWADRLWRPAPSVLETFVPVPLETPHTGPRSIFVTLGTIQPYRFDRLVDQVMPLLRKDDTVTWQLGSTTRTDLPGDVNQYLDAERFDATLAASDVVVAQARVGTLLRALELGKKAVAVPRLRSHDEHVDDHQVEIATTLHELGLATMRQADEFSLADLVPPQTQVVPAPVGASA